MLKVIPTDELRLGMFVHQIQGPWFNHPFWRRSFLLQDADDLRKLMTSKIASVQIDTNKGLPETPGGSDPKVSNNDIKIELTNICNSDKVNRYIPLTDEYKNSVKLINFASATVSRIFSEARMGKALDTENSLPLVNEIMASVARNQYAMTSLVRLKGKDDYTYMHSVAVCALMVALARELGLNDEQTRQAGLAGLFHDVGKMAIPEEILNKPDALSDDEFFLMRKHAEYGHAILSRSKPLDAICLDVCLHHHEKIDGSGYPHKMKGDEISIFAKMGAICDVYDAITSDRPYKSGWEPGIALQRMAKWTGHFDEVVFRAFVKCVGIYPIGSLVKLQSGRLGVVIDQNATSLLTPVVKMIFSTKSMTRIRPEIVDLSKINDRDRILGHEDAQAWGIKDLHTLWSE